MKRCGLLAIQVFLMVNGQVANDSDYQSEHGKLTHTAPVMVTGVLEGNKNILRWSTDKRRRWREREQDGWWFL